MNRPAAVPTRPAPPAPRSLTPAAPATPPAVEATLPRAPVLQRGRTPRQLSFAFYRP